LTFDALNRDLLPEPVRRESGPFFLPLLAAMPPAIPTSAAPPASAGPLAL
jgi:hypothetical protein